MDQVVLFLRKFHLDSRQIYFGGDDEEVLVAGGQDFFLCGSFSVQRTVDAGALGFFKSEAAGCIGLRIHIDKQRVDMLVCQRSREVDGSRRFADAAFLVRDSEYSSSHMGVGYRS
ncbi:MAG: hypothetical protein BWY82_00610 [Verrucomicrobia bacterium ADurb.Bin474]|nr:MAG: hypothetical protein BWY82_00610 [Verrucomicrobia bacterium ADurb.Bin474]